ncbi:MAG: HAD family hydrolase, partial [Dehalococcoidia bacterium]
YDFRDKELEGHVNRILDHFLALMEEQLPYSSDVQVYPGAEELVVACKEEGWGTALLTGNMERGARAKLARTGLWDRFDFGVFGGDGNRREDLPWVARERAWDVLHESFRPENMVLVGDTPNDARVARLSGTRSLIVCRRDEDEWRQAIKHEQPTWLVDGFDDVPGLIQLIKGTGS